MPVKTKSPLRGKGGKPNLVQRFNALSLVKKPQSTSRVAVASPEKSDSEATIMSLRRARPRTSPARPYRRPTAATPGADRGPAPKSRGPARRARTAPARMPSVSEAELVRGLRQIAAEEAFPPAPAPEDEPASPARFGGGESVASSVADGLTLDEGSHVTMFDHGVDASVDAAVGDGKPSWTFDPHDRPPCATPTRGAAKARARAGGRARPSLEKETSTIY